MKSQIALAAVAVCVAATVSAQSPASAFPRGSSMQSWQNPGLKNVLAKCKNPPQPFSIPGAGQSENANAAPAGIAAVGGRTGTGGGSGGSQARRTPMPRRPFRREA
jgi:hypothetical protein